MRNALAVTIGVSVFALACSSRSDSPTAPSASAGSPGISATGSNQPSSSAAQPLFNVEAILRGDGFGLVKFRQTKDPTQNIIDLDVWVRGLTPNTSYSLQRAVDTALDGVCVGTNWLTLGKGTTLQSIDTGDNGTGRAELWRDLSALAVGSAFDIHFRVIQTDTPNVALQSDCYRFVLRD